MLIERFNPDQQPRSFAEYPAVKVGLERSGKAALPIIVDTDEPARRLDLLHETVRKYGTVVNTVVPGIELAGVLHRKTEPAGSSPDRPE